MPVRIAIGPNTKNTEVRDLLQRVVAVEPIRLGRKMKRDVMNPGVPRLTEHHWRRRDDTPPLVGGKKQCPEHDPGDDESVNVDEVPCSRDADGVPAAGCGKERRDVARVIFGRPEPVMWNGDRRKSDPFSSRRAVVVKVQPRVIRENRQPTADQQHHEQKVEEVAVADPQRKSVRGRYVIHIHVGDRRDRREFECRSRSGIATE